MKIPGPDSNSTSGLNPLASTGSSTTGSASKRPDGQAGSSDEVQLSGLSNHLASALEGSPATVAKVSELYAAVSSGQYHVDAYAVSASIIQHRIEFGGTSYLALST